MQHFVVLVKFTGTGVREVANSIERVDQFRELADKAGASVDSVLWTCGEFDGVLQFSAPDGQSAAALVLDLQRSSHVRTHMMRGFDAGEFKQILAKMDS